MPQQLNPWRSGRERVFQSTRVTNDFYFDCSEDLRSQVYKCGKIWQCPGGLPQTCAGGREGVPCAECPEGENSFSSIFCEKTFVCVNMHLEST